MPCRDSASVQVRASAIWPTAAAAWLSSSFEPARRQFEHRAAERDGAGRHHQDVALAAVQRGKIGGQRGQPSFVEPAGRGIDQQRRADLHDDAAEVGKPRRVHGGAFSEAFAEAVGGAS